MAKRVDGTRWLLRQHSQHNEWLLLLLLLLLIDSRFDQVDLSCLNWAGWVVKLHRAPLHHVD